MYLSDKTALFLRTCAVALLFALTSLLSEVCAAPSNLGYTYSQAEALAREGKNDEALKIFQSITADCNNDMPEESRIICARSFLRQGELLEDTNKYSEALESYVNGMMVGETCEKGVNLMTFHNKIGCIYSLFGDYGRAKTVFEKGFAARDKYPDKKIECDILINLVGMCYFTNDKDKARKYFTLAKRLIDYSNPAKKFMSVYLEGLVMSLEGNPKATDILKKSVTLAPDDYYRCHAYEKLYTFYRADGYSDSCYKYLTLCNELASKNGMTEMYAQTLDDLSAYYKSKNDTHKANYYKTLYRELSDSVMDSAYDLSKFYKARNTQYLYEIEKSDRRISDLQNEQREKEREIRFQRTLTIILVGVLVMAGLFLWFTLRQKRRLTDAYRDLFDRNMEMLKEDGETRARIADSAAKAEDTQQSEPETPAEDTAKPQSADVASKYHTSNLNEENRQRIVDALVRVMDKEKAFCSPDFSLGRLAELIGTNQAYLSQVINECHGKSFTEYVNEYRIKEVCNRLLDTAGYGNYTIEAIAESVGFGSRSTFSRTFRKITGIPPSVYQKMSKDKSQAV